MTVSAERCQDIIAQLNGTCQALYEVCSEEEINDKNVTDSINAELFRCADCGWWCEWSEQAEQDDGEEPVCSDCKSQEE